MFTKIVAILVFLWLDIFVIAYFAYVYFLFGKNAPAFFANAVAIFVWFGIDIFVLAIGTFVHKLFGGLFILRL